jgi:predicted RNA-binding Zn-ribbon protein involved in translation (DUF1610 family)
MTFEQFMQTNGSTCHDAPSAAREFWNGALEEAAKAADEVRKQAVDKFANAADLSDCDSAYQRVVAAEKTARAIRAMQTTAGAAATPALSATNWQCPKCGRWNDGRWRLCHSSYDTGITCDGRRFFATPATAAGRGVQ